MAAQLSDFSCTPVVSILRTVTLFPSSSQSNNSPLFSQNPSLFMVTKDQQICIYGSNIPPLCYRGSSYVLCKQLFSFVCLPLLCGREQGRTGAFYLKIRPRPKFLSSMTTISSSFKQKYKCTHTHTPISISIGTHIHICIYIYRYACTYICL